MSSDNSENNNNNQNYLDIKINGRLLGLYILSNFKKYKLPPIEKQTGNDPCNYTQQGQEIELKLYQKFVASFLDFRSPFRDILIYHGLGSGKTATAINVYNVLYNYTPAWNVFLLIKASLRDSTWIKELKTFLTKEDINGRMFNIKFIHYDSPKADKDFIQAIREADSSKKPLYIFDEAHNFIRNVYNNLTSGTGKRAQIIYDYIVQEKKDNDQARVILISGTPAINSPYELALIFNLLRPDSFPRNENKFNDIYISAGNIKTLNPSTKNMFQRRTLGLISYYTGATKDTFAEKKVIYKNLIMDPYQQEVYEVYEAIEAKLEAAKIKGRTNDKTYKTYTRQACNFVFPVISEKVNGEKRPRPGQFRVSELDGSRILEGKTEKLKEELLSKEYVKDVELYMATINDFVTQTEEYFDNLNEQDIKNNHTLNDDIEIFKKEYKYKFNDFLKSKKKSMLFTKLYACSCKMTSALFYSLKSKGTILFFSNYVKMEGLQIFKLYLKYIGVLEYKGSNDLEKTKDYHRFTEFHGDISMDVRTTNKDTFNLPENKDGKIIKYILLAPAGAEGISLMNIRQIHVLDPYWNEVRIEQLIGRGIRQCSHKALPMSERKVDVYRYKAIRENGKITTDQQVEELAREKQTLIDSFLKSVKETAVDCELFKAHNMIDESYNCFQFNEKSLFDQYIGPAFKEDIEYDTKINNGLNDINSEIKRIKVIKIEGVERINENSFEEKKNYWYYPESGVVYDYDLDYPIGKVALIDGIPEKQSETTYIISNIIQIPKLKNVI
jgi:superfamily II DNA or RNA helicase